MMPLKPQRNKKNKNIKNIFIHGIRIIIFLFLILFIPFYFAGGFDKLKKDPDTVSSASLIIDQPSGEYIVIINKELHKNEENLKTWEKFFSGEEIDYLFEDISCVTALQDQSGRELLNSFRSRLPENQMKVRYEDLTLLLSKSENKRFDVILLSKEIYDAAKLSDEKYLPFSIILKEDGA